MPGSSASADQQAADMPSALRIAGELVDQRLVGRAVDAGLGDQQAGGDRDDQRRDLRDQAVADGQQGVGVRRLRRSVRPCWHDADDDAADDVDEGDEQAGDGVAAHELRGTVHGAEEGAFVLELLAALRAPRFSSIRPAERSASIAICLPGMASRVKRAATSAMRPEPLVMTTKFTITRMAKTITPMTKLPPITKLPKASMTWPAACGAFVAVGEDQARRGEVERQPQQRRDQQDGRERARTRAASG